MKTLASLSLVLLLLGCQPKQKSVTIATTPDLASIDVVSMLADAFSSESKVRTNVIVTEERLIPGLVRDGKADVVFTMSPALRKELDAASEVRLAQTIASAEYLIVGPKRDPARAKGAPTAAEALRRIARRDRAFCAPVDVPDLRARGALVWQESPASPSDNRRYRRCRGSAADVLRESSALGAYTITERTTFDRVRREVKLVPLVEHTPRLHDRIAMLLVNGRPNQNAEWFVQWVMSYRGRDAIERYRFGDERRLFIDAR